MEPGPVGDSEGRTWLVEGVEPGSHRVPEKAEVPGPRYLPVEPLRPGRGDDSGSRSSRGGEEFLGRNLAGPGKKVSLPPVLLSRFIYVLGPESVHLEPGESVGGGTMASLPPSGCEHPG